MLPYNISVLRNSQKILDFLDVGVLLFGMKESIFELLEILENSIEDKSFKKAREALRALREILISEYHEAKC